MLLHELKNDIIYKSGAIKKGNFTLASGKQSDLYVDARLLTLDTKYLTHISAQLYLKLEPLIDGNNIQAIGCPASGAIPLVAGMLEYHCWVRELGNQEPNLKGFFVRKESKEYGMQKLVEGPINPKETPSVAIVEDVCTTGQSVLRVVQIMQNLGYEVVAIGSIVDRGEGAVDLFKKYNIPYISLINREEI